MATHPYISCKRRSCPKRGWRLLVFKRQRARIWTVTDGESKQRHNLSSIALTDNIAIACRLMATQPYQFTVMAHFNIIDRIYFAGERSQDRGDRKVSGPGGIMAGLLFPLLILLDKLNKLHLLPLGKQLSVLYVCGCFCALFFGIWGYYVKSGRDERVMNYYRGRATDTPAYNYAYIIGWIVVCVVVTLIIAQCNISLPPRRVL